MYDKTKWDNIQGGGKKYFRAVCESGQNCTRQLLEQYDKKLMRERDKRIYRHKGLKENPVKTVYGEACDKWAVYERTNEDGMKCFVYLFGKHGWNGFVCHEEDYFDRTMPFKKCNTPKCDRDVYHITGTFSRKAFNLKALPMQPVE